MEWIARFLRKVVERIKSIFGKGHEKRLGPEEAEPDQEEEEQVEQPGKEKLHFTNSNYRVFCQFIKAAEKKLDIITNRLSAETFQFLFKETAPAVRVRILVGQKPRDYERILGFAASRGLDVQIFVCRRVHCKFCIRDEEAILLGSSNMVFSSLGNPQRRGNFEADIVSEHMAIVEEASNLFQTIWEQRTTYVPLRSDSSFLSSASGISTRIMHLIREAQNDVIILSPNFADKEILAAIRMLNGKIDIQLVLNWPDRSGEKARKALNMARDKKAEDGTRLFAIRPKRESIHAKVYVFDRKTALISSANLTKSSWGYMLEAGVLTDDEEIVKSVTELAERFHYKVPSPIELREEGGDGDAGTSEGPDEKYLFLDLVEGKRALKECASLYEQFAREYGEEENEKPIVPPRPPVVRPVSPVEDKEKAPPVIDIPVKPEHIPPPVEVSDLDKFFEPLSYEELARRNSSLPRQILKCAYCDFYAREDDPANPTSKICAHIEKECTKVDRGMGPARVHFFVIKGIDEIRESVISHLPRIHRCRQCGFEVNGDSQRTMIEHLTGNHGIRFSN